MWKMKSIRILIKWNDTLHSIRYELCKICILILAIHNFEYLKHLLVSCSSFSTSIRGCDLFIFYLNYNLIFLYMQICFSEASMHFLFIGWDAISERVSCNRLLVLYSYLCTVIYTRNIVYFRTDEIGISIERLTKQGRIMRYQIIK